MKTKLMALDALKLATPQNGMFDEERAKCIAAIAALEADIAKPVTPHGWMVSGVGRVYFGENAEMDATQEARQCGGTAKAYQIFTTPQEPAAPAIPEDWKRVPVEPTEEMMQASQETIDGSGLVTESWMHFAIYRAMLAAAPGGAA